MKALFVILFSITALLANYIAPMDISGSKYIDSEQAYELYKKEVKFLDVRPARFLSQGKIKNAIHLYVGDFTKDNLQKIAKQNEEVVIYCNGRGCSLTPEAITKAINYGYKKIYYYRDGFPAWQFFKLPIE